MGRLTLLPDEHPKVHRHSSIDQFSTYFSAWKDGGWAPIVFDQLDGITCDTVKTHPVVLAFSGLGYVYPEGQCHYEKNIFLTVDKHGVEEKLLPECMGGQGEFYQEFVDKRAFINFDSNDSLGLVNRTDLRVGLHYVEAEDTLPAVD